METVITRAIMAAPRDMETEMMATCPAEIMEAGISPITADIPECLVAVTATQVRDGMTAILVSKTREDGITPEDTGKIREWAIRVATNNKTMADNSAVAKVMVVRVTETTREVKVDMAII
jgi:hypothetical protein